MKLFNYFTWSLFFTIIFQALAGYNCPTIYVVNSKIAGNNTESQGLLAGIARFHLIKCQFQLKSP